MGAIGLGITTDRLPIILANMSGEEPKSEPTFSDEKILHAVKANPGLTRKEIMKISNIYSCKAFTRLLDSKKIVNKGFGNKHKLYIGDI